MIREFEIIRKIVRTGKGSLILTIPKPWSQVNDLGAGDEVIITYNFEKLIIRPKKVNQDIEQNN